MEAKSLQCDICGGQLSMDPGGKTATCKACGMEHSIERVREKVQEIRGSVIIEGSVTVSGMKTKEDLFKNADTYFYKLGNKGKAIEILKSITEDYPDDPEGWWKLYKIIYTDFSIEAEECAETAMKLKDYRTEYEELWKEYINNNFNPDGEIRINSDSSPNEMDMWLILLPIDNDVDYNYEIMNKQIIPNKYIGELRSLLIKSCVKALNEGKFKADRLILLSDKKLLSSRDENLKVALFQNYKKQIINGEIESFDILSSADAKEIVEEGINNALTICESCYMFVDLLFLKNDIKWISWNGKSEIDLNDNESITKILCYCNIKFILGKLLVVDEYHICLKNNYTIEKIKENIKEIWSLPSKSDGNKADYETLNNYKNILRKNGYRPFGRCTRCGGTIDGSFFGNKARCKKCKRIVRENM